MTFLAPFALFGILLLSLPIVVHLFKPRKMRQTPFSSLRWLKATHQRLSRRIQWHQWLLFLLRAGCILFLVVALARPLAGLWGSARPTDRFVILDASRSMAYQVPDQPTPFVRAADLTARYVQAAGSGDRTAVILAEASPRLIYPPSADASSAVPMIQALQPTQSDARLSAVLPLVRSFLPGSGEREVELVFVTDNVKGRWQQNEVQDFLKDHAGPVRVKIVDTGTNGSPNAWIASVRLFQFGADEDRWLRVEVGCNKEPNVARSVRLTGISGVADDTQAVTLKPGAMSRADFRVPANVTLSGQIAEARLEPHDALASDDVFYVNLDTSWATRVLVIEPESTGPDGRNVGLYLRVGMEVLASARNQALDVAVRTSTAVTSGDLQKADVVFLAGVPELSDTVLESLETRVRGGGGLAVFLGPQIKPAFYNERLHRPHQPTEGLSPLPLREEAQGFTRAGKPGRLTNVRFGHPLLATLEDPLLSDLSQSRFRRYGNLAGTIGKKDALLARFDDETPAIIERPIGAGRVLLFNTSANGEWSDLPSEKKVFLPLLDRMLSYLSVGALKRSFIVGESVVLPLPSDAAKKETTVTTPSGSKWTPRRMEQRGQTFLHLDGIAEAGVYRVETAGQGAILFTANADRADSSLSPMDAETLREWCSPAAFEIVSAESAVQQLEQQSNRWPLWPGLVLLAGLLLVAETIYVHRLCPRANPKSADAVVAQRGMLKPVEK